MDVKLKNGKDIRFVNSGQELENAFNDFVVLAEPVRRNHALHVYSTAQYDSVVESFRYICSLAPLSVKELDQAVRIVQIQRIKEAEKDMKAEKS